MNTLDIAAYLLSSPSIIFLAVALRGIVFWIFNIVLIFVAICLGNKIIRYKYDNQLSQIVRPNLDDASDLQISPYSNNNVETSYKYPPQTRPMVQSRYEDPAPHQIQNMATAPTTTSSYYAPASPLRIVVPPRFEQMAREQQQQQDQARSPTTMTTASPATTMTASKQFYPMNERRYFEPLKSGTDSPPISPKRFGNGDDELLRNGGTNKVPVLAGNLLEQQRISIERPHLRKTPPAVLPKPVRADVVTSISATDPHAPPPEELRGQLPWSYFKNPTDITGPKKTFTQLRDDEDLPPVPVPDYTLHFPRKDRPSTNSSSEDGGGMYRKSKMAAARR